MAKRFRFPALSTFLALLALTLVSAQDTPSPGSTAADDARSGNPLTNMTWLAGTWSGEMWGGTFEAHYSTPDGGRILSHSRLFQDGQERYFEFEVFELEDEVAHMQPYPGGKRADGFELVRLDSAERTAVFENPDKDYPTRITYQRVADDNLVITLSDPHGDSQKTERFDLRR